jgi:carbon-monoxide dehydrogenase large subunit
MTSVAATARAASSIRKTSSFPLRRAINRPVKWTEDRRENLMAMNHAREASSRLHRDRLHVGDGTILALRGDIHNDMGAYMRTNGR